jgi:hypothetical protein
MMICGCQGRPVLRRCRLPEDPWDKRASRDGVHGSAIMRRRIGSSSSATGHDTETRPWRRVAPRVIEKHDGGRRGRLGSGE